MNLIDKILLQENINHLSFLKEGVEDDARKYDTVEEFIESEIEKYTEESEEYKEWAKDSNEIIVAYHGTPYEFDEFEIGEKQSGVYVLDSISFATNHEQAEPFSQQYSDVYYIEKEKLDERYPGIEEIQNKVDKIKYEKKPRPIEKITQEGKDWVNQLDKKWKEDGEWLYNGNYKKFEQRNATIFNEIEILKDELEYNKNYKSTIVTEEEKNTLSKYNDELHDLYNSTPGTVYQVHIKGKEIIDEVGEEIGFSGTRNELVASLDGGILHIKDADTGQYIGDEIMVNDPKQVFIINSRKNIQQLVEIWNSVHE